MDPTCLLAGFPAPWTVSETTGEFLVKDASDRALAYFYWWAIGTTALLTREEARCLAEHFAEMPNIIAQRREGGTPPSRS
jgi:hypothetical protein